MSNLQYKGLLSRLEGKQGIIGQKELRKSVVFIPFIFGDGGAQLLFQERAQDIRQGGEICFPGGLFDEELDSEPSDTALRETMEELGVDPSKIALDRPFHSMITANGFWIDIYIGRLLISSLDDLSPNPDEVSRVFTVPLKTLLELEPEVYPIRLTASGCDDQGNVIFPAQDLALPERYWNAWDVITKKVYLYPTDEGQIWGITAEILKSLLAVWPS